MDVRLFYAHLTTRSFTRHTPSRSGSGGSSFYPPNILRDTAFMNSVFLKELTYGNA